MAAIQRKKSPRAPSFGLQDAIERAFKIYDREGRHAVPVDVAANHLGYKDASNGAAMAALATLRYYGLIERPREGQLAICKEFELYKFSPNDEIRMKLLGTWIRKPPIFNELLDQYVGGLPSDGTIRYDLIQKGFNASSVDSCVSAFRSSVEYARFYDAPAGKVEADEQDEEEHDLPESLEQAHGTPTPSSHSSSLPERPSTAKIKPPLLLSSDDTAEIDKIPIRLTGGRRAWIVVPSPLYTADKDRMIAQIKLLLTDDEETEE